MAGQKLGSSALLCYIRPDTADPTSSFSLTVANVGMCQAVLCRGGKPVPLSKVFSLEHDPEEAQRVKDQKAIITEVPLALWQSHPLPRSTESCLNRSREGLFSSSHDL
jgi:serine/threonine protein phosphatase PrpC